jgi:hypothetical protein
MLRYLAERCFSANDAGKKIPQLKGWGRGSWLKLTDIPSKKAGGK